MPLEIWYFFNPYNPFKIPMISFYNEKLFGFKVTGYIRRAEQLKNFTVSGEDFLPSSSSSSNSLLNSEKCLSKVTYSKGVSEESAVIETTNSTNCVCSSERDKFRKLCTKL